MINSELALLKDSVSDFSSLKRTIAGLMNGPSESDFVNIRGRIEACEKADSSIRKTLAEHEKKLKGLNSKTGNSGLDHNSGALEQCLEGLHQLRKEFEEHRDSSNKEISNINTLQLPKKANISDLEDLEERLLAKLGEL